MHSFLKGLSASKKSRQSGILFLENYRFVMLCTLGIFRHAHLKQEKFLKSMAKVFLHLKIKTIYQTLLVILHFKEFCNLIGYLNMHDHAHQKRYYQLIENIDVYLYTKNQLHHPLLSQDITL